MPLASRRCGPRSPLLALLLTLAGLLCAGCCSSTPPVAVPDERPTGPPPPRLHRRATDAELTQWSDAGWVDSLVYEILAEREEADRLRDAWPASPTRRGK